MPIDPSIALSAKPVEIESPLNRLAKFTQIQNAQNQNRLADISIQDHQRELDDMNMMRGVSKSAVDENGQFDRQKYLTGVAQAGYGDKLPGLQKGFADADTAALKLQKDQIDQHLQQFQVVGQIMAPVKDQATYDQARQQIAQILGPEAAAHQPDVYDPGVIEQAKAKAMSVKDQLEQTSKAIEQKLNANKFTEEQRHNKATEGLTARGQTMENARAGVNPDGSLNGDTQSMVDAIGQYKVQPPNGMALRNPRMQGILAEVTKQYPDFDATTYGARQQAAKSFSTGKDGQSVQSANTALNHLETLSQLAAAQNNGDMRLFNQIANKIATETGGAAPTNLQGAITMVGPEISKAVVGSGGTGGDRDKVDSALQALVKGGPAQAAGQIATMKDLFGGRLSETKRTYERTTGRKDFEDSFLSPAAQAVLKARTSQPSGAFATPTTNAQGWALHVDAKGNKAYVSPDGKQFQEVQ